MATSVADANSYGDLFQWGRWDDGHQLRNSQIVPAPSPNTPEGTSTTAGAYVTGSPAWWANFASGDTWNGASLADVNASVGIDPCKAIGPDWKMPSQADWTTLIGAESIGNPATAYSSNLKLPAGGYRSSSDGELYFCRAKRVFLEFRYIKFRSEISVYRIDNCQSICRSYERTGIISKMHQAYLFFEYFRNQTESICNWSVS